MGFDLPALAQRPVWPECEPYGYPCTPPELFVFGSPGVDGIHYGFVVHAPELSPYPLAALNPMDTEGGVRALGSTDAQTDALLGPGGSQAPVFDPRWPAIEPEVPQGWRHEPTSDGVGVLALANAFGDAPAVLVLFAGCDDAPPELDDVPSLAPRMGGANQTVRLVTANLEHVTWENALERTGIDDGLIFARMQVLTLEGSGPTIFNMQESSEGHAKTGGALWPTVLHLSLGASASTSRAKR